MPLYAVDLQNSDVVVAAVAFFFFFEHNRTSSGKKTVTGVQVITVSQVQSIRFSWQAISSYP